MPELPALVPFTDVTKQASPHLDRTFQQCWVRPVHSIKANEVIRYSPHRRSSLVQRLHLPSSIPLFPLLPLKPPTFTMKFITSTFVIAALGALSAVATPIKRADVDGNAICH